MWGLFDPIYSYIITTMTIVSSRSGRKDNTAKVHTSSLETKDLNDSQAMILNVDIVFHLEINQFPTAEGELGHQLMLSVTDVSSVVHQAGLGVQHLVDLGVLSFSENNPGRGAPMICRDENGLDLWVLTENLQKVWQALLFEMFGFREVVLEPPLVPEKRQMKVAIQGMDYFNGFVSSDLIEQQVIYLSSRHAGVADHDVEFSFPELFR